MPVNLLKQHHGRNLQKRHDGKDSPHILTVSAKRGNHLQHKVIQNTISKIDSQHPKRKEEKQSVPAGKLDQVDSCLLWLLAFLRTVNAFPACFFCIFCACFMEMKCDQQ